MSIVGYLMKPRRELRMPKGEDSVGIKFEGPVGSGEKSVEQSMTDDVTRTLPGLHVPGGPILNEILLGKPVSLTPIGELSPAERMHLRLPGKF